VWPPIFAWNIYFFDLRRCAPIKLVFVSPAFIWSPLVNIKQEWFVIVCDSYCFTYTFCLDSTSLCLTCVQRRNNVFPLFTSSDWRLLQLTKDVGCANWAMSCRFQLVIRGPRWVYCKVLWAIYVLLLSVIQPKFLLLTVILKLQLSVTRHSRY